MTRLHTRDLQSPSSVLVRHPGVQSGCAVAEAALLASCLTCWITFGPRVQYLEMYVCCLSTLVIGTW